jgi:hypothetical protein
MRRGSGSAHSLRAVALRCSRCATLRIIYLRCMGRIFAGGLKVRAAPKNQSWPSYRCTRTWYGGLPLESAHMQTAVGKVDGVPTQRNELARPQPAPEGDQHHGGVPVAFAVVPGSDDQTIDLGVGQIPARGASTTLARAGRSICSTLMAHACEAHTPGYSQTATDRLPAVS